MAHRKEQKVREIIQNLREKSIIELEGKLRKDAISLLSQDNDFLFELKGTYGQYLRIGKIDIHLKYIFDENKQFVSINTDVLKTENKKKWELRDGFKRYLIEDKGKRLSVYWKKFDVSLLGVLDYRVYGRLKEQSRQLYFIFIDVQNSTLKPKIGEYLNERKIMSFNLGSDMDIVAILLSSRVGVEQFKDDLFKNFGKKIDFHVYRALTPLYLDHKRIPPVEPDISGIDINTITLSKIQKDYSDPSLKNEYDSLRGERVLIGHSVLYDFRRLGESRDFALLFDVDKSQEPLFNQYDEVKKHIIDLCELYYELPWGAAGKDYTSFYSKARYIAYLEFTYPEEKANWEKMVGTIFKDSNVFYFPVNDIYFPGPYGVSDVEFDMRCNSYWRKDEVYIYIGNGIRNGFELPDRKVGLSLDSVNGNGIILGETQMGKSTAMRKMISGFLREKLTIHIVNPTQDTIDELKNTYLDKVVIHELYDLKECAKGFDDFHGGIHIFSLNSKKKTKTDEVKNIIEAIEVMPLLSLKAGKTKLRQIKHILFIDETHDFFVGAESKYSKEMFANILVKLSHRGMAMYIITQELSHLQIDKKKSLANLLQNRIIYRMGKDEAKAAAMLLAKDGIDSLYRLENEIPTLQPKIAFVKFGGGPQ